MNSFKISVFIICFLNCSELKSQELNFYTFTEIGSKYQVLHVSNYSGSNEFGDQLWYSTPIFGLAIGAKTNNVSLESGLYHHKYLFQIRGKSFGMVDQAFSCVQIPLRLKYDILPNSKKWDLNIGIGYNIGIPLKNNNRPLNPEDRATLSSSVHRFDENGLPADSSFRGMKGGVVDNKLLHLFETRVEVAYNLSSGLGFHLGITNINGFKKILEVDAIHQKNIEPIDRARYSSKGGYLGFLFGLKYSICSFRKEIQ